MKHLFTLFSVLVYGNPNTLCSPVNLQHIYVNGAATGNNSGSSWPHAFTRLQDAIAIAEAGDTIWVAEGTYKPTDDTDREKRFLLKNGVVLLGGFNGTECTTVERDPTLYETILSGDIGVSGDSTDNSFHVLFTIGTDSTTVLDGFTITGGQAIHPDGNAYSGHLDKGGGLYVGTIATLPYASPRIRNCRFIYNTGKNGGAIYCDGTFDDRSADPIFESCTFEYNQATSAGGAIHKKGLSHPDRAFTVRNCRFGYNRSAREGGAIYLFDAGNFSVFSNTHFYHNFAISSGGAVYYETPFESSLMRMDDCSFTDNIGRSGGGITMTITGYYPNGTAVHKVELYRAVFERNQGLNSTGGLWISITFPGIVAPLSYPIPPLLKTTAFLREGEFILKIAVIVSVQ